MAPFNPQVPDTQDPNYLGYSHSIEQPKPNTTLGEVFKGIGDTLKAGVSAVDTTIKENIDNQLRKAVEPEREGFISSLERIRQGAVGRAQSLFSGKDYSDAPHEVQQLGDRLENLQESYVGGKFTPLEYKARLFTALRDIRGNNPGYLDYIDEKSSKITGFNIANAYMSSLLSDLNQSVSSAKSIALKQDQFVKENIGIIGDNRMQQWQQGKVDFNTLELLVAKRKSEYEDTKYAENKLKDLKLGLEEKQFTANTYLDKRLPQLVNNMLEDTADAAGTNFKKISERVTSSLNGGPKIDPIEGAKLGAKLAGLRPMVVKAAYDEAVKTGAVAALGSDVVNKKIEASLASTFDPIVKATGDGNYTTANYYARVAKAIEEKDSLSVLLDPVMGPPVRKHKALESLFGNNNLFQKFIDLELQRDKDLPNKLHLFKMESLTSAIIQPDFNHETNTPGNTIKGDLDKLPAAGIKQGGDNSKYIGSTTKSITDITKVINNPTVPEEGRNNLAKYWAFDPFNYGVLDKFDMEHVNPKTGRIVPGAYEFWDKVTNKQFAQNVFKLAENDSDTGNRYINWTLEGFGNSLFRRTMNSMRDMANNKSLSFEYNSETKELKILPSTGTRVTPNTIQETSRLPTVFNDRFRAGVDPNVYYPNTDISQVAYDRAKFNISQFQRGLNGLKNVEEASGGKFHMDAYIMDLFHEMGFKPNPTGSAPEKIMNSILTSNTKPEPQKGSTTPTDDRTGVKKEEPRVDSPQNTDSLNVPHYTATENFNPVAAGAGVQAIERAAPRQMVLDRKTGRYVPYEPGVENTVKGKDQTRVPGAK